MKLIHAQKQEFLRVVPIKVVRSINHTSEQCFLLILLAGAHCIIHLRENGEKQNGFLVCFGYRGASLIDSCMFEISLLFCLTSFDHLIYHVTLCAQTHIMRGKISTFYYVYWLQYCYNKPNFGLADYPACVVYIYCGIY